MHFFINPIKNEGPEPSVPLCPTPLSANPPKAVEASSTIILIPQYKHYNVIQNSGAKLGQEGETNLFIPHSGSHDPHIVSGSLSCLPFCEITFTCDAIRRGRSLIYAPENGRIVIYLVM